MDSEEDEQSSENLLRKDLLPHPEIVKEDRPQGDEIEIDHGPGDTQPLNPSIIEDMAYDARQQDGISQGPPGDCTDLVQNNRGCQQRNGKP